MINHQVVHIPSDKNSISDSLGITDERKEEILEFMNRALKNKDLKTTSADMEAATEIATNVNETAFICYVIGSAKCGSECPIKGLSKIFEGGTMIGPFRIGNDEEE